MADLTLPEESPFNVYICVPACGLPVPTLPSLQPAPASQVCKMVSMATFGELLILDIPEVFFFLNDASLFIPILHPGHF